MKHITTTKAINAYSIHESGTFEVELLAATITFGLLFLASILYLKLI